MDQFREVIDSSFGGVFGAAQRLELIDLELNRYWEWRKIVSLFFHDNGVSSFEALVTKNPETFFQLAKQAERIKTTPKMFQRS